MAEPLYGIWAQYNRPGKSGQWLGQHWYTVLGVVFATRCLRLAKAQKLLARRVHKESRFAVCEIGADGWPVRCDETWIEISG